MGNEMLMTKKTVEGIEKEVQICKECLMLSTRPRLTYNEDGVCSACQWSHEKKTTVDWAKRKEELKAFCDKYRSESGFDVIVPVSGGKDSSMIAHKLKYVCGMNPLCMNINHYVDCNTEMNEINLKNFVKNGFELFRVYPNQKIERDLDRIGLVQYGQPYFGWMTSMVLAPLKLATKFNIPFIMYGEEGEVEYGGSTELKNKPIYTVDDTVRFYLSGVHPNTYLDKYTEKELYWWLPPSNEDIQKLQPAVAHWSYFENWNSNYNYEYAKKYVGLKEQVSNSVGTYNNFAQTDGILYPLHTYFMYLKFGFGRCSQDVCIDIRSGKITREEGIELINKYDETYPEQFEEQYLEYYQLTKQEFYDVIDKFANKDLLEKRNGRWVKKFKLV
ncbi:N-acetyl sugar amidotransferase [bacterium]|nr:N-acetyl sugar amidotransferase [bacterium]